MFPILAIIPLWPVIAFIAGAMGAAFSGKSLKTNILTGIGCALAGGILARTFFPAERFSIPVQSYGFFVLTGFIVAVILAEWRVKQIGIARYHILDMGLTGCFLGILAARVFYIVMNWSEFSPFTPAGFNPGMIVKMIKLWEGGLVFYGAFVVAIPWTYYYCVKNKIPPIPFLDVAAPGLICGLAFGRIGCYMTGCCYGRTCSLPWAITFPKDSPAYFQQFKIGMLNSTATSALPVHPTQLYAAVAAVLTYTFLMLYWPRRLYDGQVLSLMMIMAGATRFFEEILRSDDAPPFPALSQSWTIAQWVALLLITTGFSLMFYFRKRNSLYVPPLITATA